MILEKQQPSSQKKIKKQHLYRISKSWRQVHIPFTQSIAQVLPFPNYVIWILFSNGKYRLHNIMSQALLLEGKIAEESKFATIVSDQSIVYLDQNDQKLRILDLEHNHLLEGFAPQFPTQAAIPDQSRNEDNVSNLINYGVQLVVGNDAIVALEQKLAYTHHGDNILTVWKPGSSDPVAQLVFQLNANSNSNTLFLTLMNGGSRLLVWRKVFLDQPLEFFFWEIGQASGHVISLEEPNSLTLLHCQQIAPGEICLVGNYNSQGRAFYKIINWVEQQEVLSQDIEIRSKEQEKVDYILNEVVYHQPAHNLLVFCRSDQSGQFLDIYNPATNSVTHSTSIDQDQGIIYRPFDPTSKYFIEYEYMSSGENSEDQEMLFDFTVNSVVSVRTSLVYFLEQSNLLGKNKENKEHIYKQIIDMLTTNQAN